jgi:hypothetical protein
MLALIVFVQLKKATAIALIHRMRVAGLFFEMDAYYNASNLKLSTTPKGADTSVNLSRSPPLMMQPQPLRKN